MAPIIQTCGRCGREVYHAEKKIALNKVWHDFCFNCVICQKRLNSQNFNSHRGELFCHSCYAQVTSNETDCDNHQSTRRKESSQSSSTESRNSSEDFPRQARAEIVEICNLRPSEIKNAIRRRNESLDRSAKERRRTREDIAYCRPPQYYNRQRRNAVCGFPTVEKEISVNKSKKNNPSDKKPNEESFHKTAKDIRKISSPVMQEKKKLFTEDDSAYETEPQHIYKNILPSYFCKGDDCTCPKNAVYSEIIYDSSFPKTEDNTLHKLNKNTHQKLTTQIIDSEELYKSDRPKTSQSYTPEEIEEILFISESGTTKIVKKTFPKKGKYKEMSHKKTTDVTPKKSINKYNLNEDSGRSLHKTIVKDSAKETKKKKFHRNDEETTKNLSNKKKTDESSKNRKKTKSTNEEITFRSSKNKDHPQKIPKSTKKPQKITKENVQETPLPTIVEKPAKTVEKSWFLPKCTLFNKKKSEFSDKLKVIEEIDEHISRNSGETKRLKSQSSDSILTERRRKYVKNSSVDSRNKLKSQNSLEDIFESTYKNTPNIHSSERKENKSRRKSSKLRESSDSKNNISPLIKNKLNVYETAKEFDSFIQKSLLKKNYKSTNLNEAAQNITRKSKIPETDRKHTKELKHLNKPHKNIETSKIKDKNHTKTTSKQISSKDNFTSPVKNKQHNEETASLDEFITLNMKYTPQNNYNKRKIINNESPYNTTKKNIQKSSKNKKQTDDNSLDMDILKPKGYNALKDDHNDKKKSADHQTRKKDVSKKISSNNFQQKPNKKGNFKRISKTKSSDKELFTTVYNIYPEAKEDIVKTFIQTVRTPKKPANFDNEDSFKRLSTSKNKNSLARLNSDRKRNSFDEDIDDLQVGRFVVTNEIGPKMNKMKILHSSGDNTKKEATLSKNDSTKLKTTAEVSPTKCVTKTCRENKVTKKQSFLNSTESNNLYYSNKKNIANIKKTKTPKTVLNEDISQSMISKRVLASYASKCDREREKEKSVEKLRKKSFFDPIPPRAKSGASNTVIHPCQESVLDIYESLFKRPTRDGAKNDYRNFGIWGKKNNSMTYCFNSCFVYFVPTHDVSRSYICKRCNKNVFVVERVFAENEVFHNNCFSCYICNRHLDSLNVFPRKGEIYCKHCYMKYFGPHTYGFGLCANLYY